MEAANSEIHAPSTQKDEYCYICEDGGALMECTFCTKAFCYGILGAVPQDSEHQPCVSVTEQMARDENHAFPCPDCLSEAQARSAPYVIHRGARMTMRLASRTSVVLVVFYLESLKRPAWSIHDQIQAMLCAFEINLATICLPIRSGITAEQESHLQEQLLANVDYHMAVVFVTESQPGGGYWSKSGAQASQSDEGDFLRFVGNQCRHLARAALSVRYFGAVCGWNLCGPGVLPTILDTLTPTRVLSFVVPTTGSLLICDYAHIFPELFLNLYYFGADLRPSLYKVWGKSEEVRKHTGLLTIDRKEKEKAFSVTKLIHSPPVSRPLGVQLPIPTSICGCHLDRNNEGVWVFKKEVHNGHESIFVYQSGCCRVGLQVAIFPNRRRSIQRNQTLYTEEDINPLTRSFDFKQSTMVRMKHFPPTTNGMDAPLVFDTPWTIAGKGLKHKTGSSST